MPDGRIKWDQTADKRYETGTDRGTVYKFSNNAYGKAVPWSGLTAVTHSPEGAEATDIYADNIKFASFRSAETVKGTIEAYCYPDEVAELDGTAEVCTGMYVGQQARGTFGFVYRSWIGGDGVAAGTGTNYKYHLFYGCSISPSEKNYKTVNDSPEANTFSWEFDTTPIKETVNGTEYTTAEVTLDCSKMDAEDVTALENLLFGKDAQGSSGTATDGKMPTLAELYAILGA